MSSKKGKKPGSGERPSSGGSSSKRKSGAEATGTSGGKASSSGKKSKNSNSKKSGEKSLRRSVSPRKEQYSHLLDETAGRGDMVLLEPLTENGLIENLKVRYKAQEIYVSYWLM